MGSVRVPVVAIVGVGLSFAVLCLVVIYLAGGTSVRANAAPDGSTMSPIVDRYPTLTSAPTLTATSSATATITPTEQPSSTATSTPSATPSPLPTSTATVTPTRTPVVVNQTVQFHVDAGQTHAEDVNLPAGAIIRGAFTISANDLNFALWQTKPVQTKLLHQDRVKGTYQFSYTVTSAGRYALFFDNTYSILTGKDVSLKYSVITP